MVEEDEGGGIGEKGRRREGNRVREGGRERRWEMEMGSGHEALGSSLCAELILRNEGNFEGVLEARQ